MRDVLYLAWRYLWHHRWTTAVLVASITLISYLPVGLRVVVGESARQLTARADATPLLVGAKGSPLELVLSSLYFDADSPAPTSMAAADSIRESGLATAIPLYVRFAVRDVPIVATSPEYFDFRGLRPAEGRLMAILGECVLGARAAETLGVTAGDAVVSSPESVFDLAGVYPLKMEVVGILAPTHTPDDDAVFVDIKTGWVIEGLGHGHQDLSTPEAAAGVLAREGDSITANASVQQYNEITPDNIDSFHFHGDPADFPLSAVLVLPKTDKSGVILMGRYESPDESHQIVRPSEVMEQLLDTVFTIREFVVGAILLVAVATAATAALVFVLSIRLRRQEIATMHKIGGSRARVGAILASEILVVVATSVLLAAGLTWLTSHYGGALIRALLLS